nr:MAG TPA: hypothetical protein [Caudoviricetes sp.]
MDAVDEEHSSIYLAYLRWPSLSQFPEKVMKRGSGHG